MKYANFKKIIFDVRFLKLVQTTRNIFFLTILDVEHVEKVWTFDFITLVVYLIKLL